MSGEPPAPGAAPDLWAEQAAYYDARADEYDDTAYGDTGGDRIEAVLDLLTPRGRALEVACGTGQWTARLAQRCGEVDAFDISPRALAIARERTRSLPRVRLSEGDARWWRPAPTDPGYDVILMAFWLSHVPRDQWAALLDRFAGLLAPAGRLVVVDEQDVGARGEQWVRRPGEVVVRQVRSGEAFRIYKSFVDPDSLARCLLDAGLEPTVRTDREWVVCSATRTDARPAPQPPNVT